MLAPDPFWRMLLERDSGARSGRRTEILSCARSALSDDRGLANRCSSILPALLSRSRFGADARDGEFSIKYNLSLGGTLYQWIVSNNILCYLVKWCWLLVGRFVCYSSCSSCATSRALAGISVPRGTSRWRVSSPSAEEEKIKVYRQRNFEKHISAFQL